MIKVRLAKILEERGKKRYWLWQKSGLLQATVYDLVDEKSKRLDFKTIEGICRALNCQPGDFLVFEETEQDLKSDK